jgi:hypothetical protein
MGQPYPGAWTFRYHPWLRGMHNSDVELNVGQKAAQMGFTETMLNLCFFYIDIMAVDCLYILPAKTPDASDFSASRFDPALELSPHLNNLFSDVKNVGLKQAGNTNFYLRGSKSRSGLKSIPVGILIFDELDEMVQDNIPLAVERQSGQRITRSWEISTPTIDGFGINASYINSSQNVFYFKCPGCSRFIDLDFPRNIEIHGESHIDLECDDSFLKCHLCNIKLPHETKPDWLATGRWEETNTQRAVKGWWVNQLYSSSPKVNPGNIVKSYHKSRIDPASEQEFYNSKLGKPHIVEGARLNDVDIKECMGDYIKADFCNTGLTTMGVDVGTYLHYEIDLWKVVGQEYDLNISSIPRLIKEGSVFSFDELDELMEKYNISGVVIDAQPERRKAYEFCCRHFGRAKMCFYGRGIQGKQIHINQEDECQITVDRTSWLDLSIGRFKTRRITLPKDLSMEYKTHLKSLVRIYEKDPDGNAIGKYVKAGNDHDHLAHSRNYAEIALPIAASLSSSYNMASPL